MDVDEKNEVRFKIILRPIFVLKNVIFLKNVLCIIIFRRKLKKQKKRL